MNAFLRALDAERLKLRGTLAAWSCVIAPAAVVALPVLQLCFSRLPASRSLDAVQAWGQFSHSVFGLWLFLMLPLLITLQAALLAALEHGDRHWKHLLALPVPRSTHFLAKLVMLAAMVAAGFLVLVLLLPVGGWVLMQFKPAFGLGGWPDFGWILRTAALAFGASMLMVALHTWASIRWRSFTVAVSLGMGATVAGFLIGQSGRFGPWYPWSMPLHVMATDSSHVDRVVAVGIVGGLVAATLAVADLCRREFD